MGYRGSLNKGQTVDIKRTMVNTAGVPTTLGGSPVVSIYKDNSTTQTTTGVTLTIDFDGLTGLIHIRVDTNADATFYSSGSDFFAVITTGTVNGASVAGYELGDFDIENRAGPFAIT